MTSPSTTSHRLSQRVQRDGFFQLLHAEWSKFRTVAGWVIGMTAAALTMVLFALLAGISGNQKGSPSVPIGPSGGPVTDSFYFVHQPLAGDGSITVSVSALNSSIPEGPGELRPGTVPWAKAGLIIKKGTDQGSPYAAIMVTGSHGVRMQHNYVHDTAGPVSAAAARWLRLDRSGDAITGYASTDGTNWTKVATARVSGLGSTAQIGLFVASPPAVGGGGTAGTVSTATFGDLRTPEGWAGGDWTGGQVGAKSPTFAGYPENASGSFTASDARFTVTGAGDIAPAVRDSLPTGGQLRDILTGTFAALIVVIVVGALFITEEYRNKMIHLTLAASPRRSLVLVAKAIVLWAVTFVAGLVGAILATPLGERLARGNGVYIFPVPSSTELRVELGTAALLATASVLALAVGAIFRHSAGAVTTVVVAIVLPYILIAIPFMPAAVSKGVATVTPGAAFAVQQTLVPYDQVASNYTPYYGYYPLAPWAGVAVLAGYALASLAVAAVVLSRRDA
ncbi:ABC-type transport system involved in multi-copper enzyme maturation permease subunit [Kribbella antiqua]|uniref:ABC-type transport system involved in multi-copper enzyme maturation permease subunit n=1 Tax=Kribbella antiqua TaxID=2512217 RepID=A0A4R2II97_9ACTN|nr:ABC transporter permease subunit [Kribbella antiqua]TCO42445.1 ABC-type transport system involved in multi-copper enzyme maturation permease subunit [Kribbella antiqua]